MAILGRSTYPLLNFFLGPEQYRPISDLEILDERLSIIPLFRGVLEHLRRNVAGLDLELSRLLHNLRFPTFTIEFLEIVELIPMTTLVATNALGNILMRHYSVFTHVFEDEVAVYPSPPILEEDDSLPYLDTDIYSFDFVRLINNENQLRAELHVPENFSLESYIGLDFDQIMILFNACNLFN